MPVIYCACGDAVTQKAFDEAVRLKADSYRCEICLIIWLESPTTQRKLKGETKMKQSKITAEVVEQCAFEGLSKAEAAARIGVAETTFTNAIYTKGSEINEAWNRGKQRRLDANGSNNGTPSSEPRLNEIAKTMPDFSKIEKTKNLPTMEETFIFDGGASLTIHFTGDLFKLKYNDANFVMSLLNTAVEYKHSNE